MNKQIKQVRKRNSLGETGIELWQVNCEKLKHSKKKKKEKKNALKKYISAYTEREKQLRSQKVWWQKIVRNF